MTNLKLLQSWRKYQYFKLLMKMLLQVASVAEATSWCIVPPFEKETLNEGGRAKQSRRKNSRLSPGQWKGPAYPAMKNFRRERVDWLQICPRRCECTRYDSEIVYNFDVINECKILN